MTAGDLFVTAARRPISVYFQEDIDRTVIEPLGQVIEVRYQSFRCNSLTLKPNAPLQRYGGEGVSSVRVPRLSLDCQRACSFLQLRIYHRWP